MADGVRVAGWSGPRNISTAMMRAWENRPDTTVVDEPLYAHYLHATGVEHPGRDEVLASQPTVWREVVERLLGPVPGGHGVWYQKHMCHHLTAEVGLDWLDGLRNVLLIRDPHEVLLSLTKVFPDAGVADTGLPQQVRLYEHLVESTGTAPPVLDARDVLEQPRTMLALMCDAVGVAFDESMLSWPAGARETDGVWAPHWYASVEASTGWAPYRPRTEELPDDLRPVLEECRELYAALHAQRLRP